MRASFINNTAGYYIRETMVTNFVESVAREDEGLTGTQEEVICGLLI